jgi:hypothetical protein
LAHGNYRQGDVVTARVIPLRGETKIRPVIILSRDIDAAHPVHILAISSSFEVPPVSRYVFLPFDPAGKCHTGLRKKCAAVLDWQTLVPLSDILEWKGNIRPALLAEILMRVQNYHSRD